MKQAKRLYTKGFDKKVFFKHGSFAQYNKVNPLLPAITTPAFVTEVLMGIFSRGQDSEGHGNKRVSQHRLRHAGSAAPTATKPILWLKRKCASLQPVPIHLFKMSIKTDPMSISSCPQILG